MGENAKKTPKTPHPKQTKRNTKYITSGSTLPVHARYMNYHICPLSLSPIYIEGEKEREIHEGYQKTIKKNIALLINSIIMVIRCISIYKYICDQNKPVEFV